MKSQPDSSEKIFTRDFALLFLANFIVVAVYFLLMTTMVTYAVRNFNADGATAGLVASIFLIGGVIGRIISARYANHWGLRRMILVALVIQLASCALYFLDVLGVFMALGFGTSMSTGQAAATTLTKGNTALAISTFFLLCDGGCGIGPYLLGFVLDAVGYQAMYLLCAGIAFAAFLYCFFVACPPSKPESNSGLTSL